MAYAIELYFDSHADGIVRSLWKQIEEAGVESGMVAANYRPHISLGVCEDLDADRFCSALTTFAQSLSPVELVFSSLGLFTRPEGVLFLGVTVNHDLLDIHQRFNQIIRTYTTGLREYYCTDRWVPHCTLAFGLSPGDLLHATGACIPIELPLTTTILQIGISEVTPKSCTALFEIGTGAAKS